MVATAAKVLALIVGLGCAPCKAGSNYINFSQGQVAGLSNVDVQLKTRMVMCQVTDLSLATTPQDTMCSPWTHDERLQMVSGTPAVTGWG